MTYQCSTDGCYNGTQSNFCDEHRRHCSECGSEQEVAQLFGGKCRECHRIDNAYAGCASACCECTEGECS